MKLHVVHHELPMSRTRNFLADFRAFINRGNVVDLAVAVVIGSAFGKVVDSIVSLVMGLCFIPFSRPSMLMPLPTGLLEPCWWP